MPQRFGNPIEITSVEEGDQLHRRHVITSELEKGRLERASRDSPPPGPTRVCARDELIACSARIGAAIDYFVSACETYYIPDARLMLRNLSSRHDFAGSCEIGLDVIVEQSASAPCRHKAALDTRSLRYLRNPRARSFTSLLAYSPGIHQVSIRKPLQKPINGA